ncbi:MAG: 50S ribosomal protein L10 [bacterium]|nr:50S ribosomal protein L10 [bacterium]
MGSRHDKQLEVAELAGRLGRAVAAIFTDYRGLGVAEITELRKRLGRAGVEYRVVKNTLTRLAARNAGLVDIESLLEGPTAIAFGYEDPVIPAQVLASFARDHKELEFKGGLVEGQLLDRGQVQALADLPPASELRAMLARSLAAPVVSLATVLHAPLQGLARSLEAVRAKRVEQAGTAA